MCKLELRDKGLYYQNHWEAGRELSRGLLAYLQEQVGMQRKTLDDITGIVVYRGPGSFTGLRIGITVVTALAYANTIPIVGEVGDRWQETGLKRLERGDTDIVVLPEYGAEAHITQPRK